ncbi:MAG: ABC transporter ATP-binding protein [Kibdelosporangium sp.]
MAVLEIADVTRTFSGRRDTVQALDGVSLSVDSGELVGLLGLNGAGKTTLLKIVATLLSPTSGTVTIDGVNVAARPREARRKLSLVLGGDRGLYPLLSARDNVKFFATLSGLRRSALPRRTEDVLRFVGLGAMADRPVGTYSKGMRQRVHLAIGLVSRPQLLLLDEPTVGLDPVEAANIRAAVDQMRAEGSAIILTSHYLQDIEQLAERVVVLDKGKVLHDLPLSQLIDHADAAAIVTIRGGGASPVPALPALADGVQLDSHHEDADGWMLSLRVRSWSRQTLLNLAAAWPSHYREVRVTSPGLEDVFAALAQRTGTGT